MNEVIATACFAHAPHEHRDVRALPAAVRVQFAEHEKTQVLCSADQLRVERPREQQLEHDAVRGQDVGRAREGLPRFGVELAGCDQLLDRLARFERRAELKQWIRPEVTFGERGIDELANAQITDREEAADVIGVLADYSLAKIEYIHV